jgi:hypothetical protein
MSGRSRHNSTRKSSNTSKRVLRNEFLEPREMLSGNGFSSSGMWIYPPSPIALVGAAAPANAAPTVAQQIIVNGNGAVTGKSASLYVLGKDDGGETKLAYNWSVTSMPAGGKATFNVNGTNAAKNAIVTFTKAGTYTLSVRIVDAKGLAVNCVKSVVVTQTVYSIKNLTTTPFNISEKSLKLPVPTFIDQFGNTMSATPVLAWSTSAAPQGSPAPIFTTAGGASAATFGAAGYYILTARATNFQNVSFAIAVNVNQALTSIVVSPNKPSIFKGATQ